MATCSFRASSEPSSAVDEHALQSASVLDGISPDSHFDVAGRLTDVDSPIYLSIQDFKAIRDTLYAAEPDGSFVPSDVHLELIRTSLSVLMCAGKVPSGTVLPIVLRSLLQALQQTTGSSTLQDITLSMGSNSSSTPSLGKVCCFLTAETEQALTDDC